MHTEAIECNGFYIKYSHVYNYTLPNNQELTELKRLGPI